MSNNFYENVLSWAMARNIPKGARPKRQRTKTWEELSELATGLAKSDLDEDRMKAIKDAMGDCAVTTANVAACAGYDSVRIGHHGSEVAQARRDVFDVMDNDDLLNCFVAHQAIVKTAHDDNSTAFLPFVVSVEDNLAISLAALEILATRLGLKFSDCQDFAWGQIKDRKGMAINGIFVKEDNGEVEKSLNAVVNAAVDVAVEHHAHKFATDHVGALNDIWNDVKGYVHQSTGDTLNLTRSAAGMNADAATLTFTFVFDTYKTITVETSRTVNELKTDDDVDVAVEE